MMKKLLTLLLLVVFAVVGWFFASPYWTLYQLKSAAQAQDIDTMVTYVDFDSVRSDLKEQLKTELTKEFDPAGQTGFEALGVAIAMAAVDGLVEKMITPSTIKTVLEGKNLADNLTTSQTASNAQDAQNTPTYTQPNWQFDTNYQNINQFAVNVKNPEQKDAQVILTRDGLFSWKVSKIKLPLDQ